MKIAVMAAVIIAISNIAYAEGESLVLKNSVGSRLEIRNMDKEGFEFDFTGINPKTKKSCGGVSGFTATWVQPNKKATWISNGGCEMTFTMSENGINKITIQESKGCIPGCGVIVVEKQKSVDLSGDYRKTDKGSFDSVSLKKTPSGYSANLSASYGANIGDINIDIPLGAVDAGKYNYKTDGCNLAFVFKAKSITVTGHKDGMCDAGSNVNFNGNYKKLK